MTYDEAAKEAPQASSLLLRSALMFHAISQCLARFDFIFPSSKLGVPDSRQSMTQEEKLTETEVFLVVKYQEDEPKIVGVSGVATIGELQNIEDYLFSYTSEHFLDGEGIYYLVAEERDEPLVEETGEVEGADDLIFFWRTRQVGFDAFLEAPPTEPSSTESLPLP